MNRTMMDLCVSCRNEVTNDQDAVECDSCGAWTHRTCGTNIPRQMYIAATRGELDLEYECRECSPPLDDLDETIEARDDGVDNSRDLFSDDGDNNADDDGNLSDFAVDVSFIRPPDILEESLVEPEPMDIPMEEGPITYQELADGTQKGKRSLTDSLGFRYNVNKKPTPANPTTYWICKVRTTNHVCGAKVRERNGIYIRGDDPHDHAAEPGIMKATQIIRDIKNIAKNNPFDSANSIIEDILHENVDDRDPIASIPKSSYLKRTANRVRQKGRPLQPRDLDFVLDPTHVPDDFLIGDIRVDNKRHLVFATPNQLKLLQTATTWYIDSTFKIAKDPFTQMFSIHGFVQSGGEMKQVPLAFALMSRKTTEDYIQVIQCVKNNLPGIILVKNCVLDFEAGMWGAMRRLFPRIRLAGCVFHWAQAVFRNVKSIGLEPAFRHDDATYRIIKRLLALPYLPAEHIPPSFETLKRHVYKAVTAVIEDTIIPKSLQNFTDKYAFMENIIAECQVNVTIKFLDGDIMIIGTLLSIILVNLRLCEVCGIVGHDSGGDKTAKVAGEYLRRIFEKPSESENSIVTKSGRVVCKSENYVNYLRTLNKHNEAEEDMVDETTPPKKLKPKVPGRRKGRPPKKVDPNTALFLAPDSDDEIGKLYVREDAKESKKTSPKDRPFQCEQCSYTATRLIHMQKHQAHHLKTPTLFKCRQCPFTAIRNGVLRRHEITHSTHKLKCNVCKYVTDSMPSLKRHLHLKHNSNINVPPKTSEKCPHCSFVSSSKPAFARHMSLHMKVNYGCPLCTYKTAHRHHMRRHVTIVHSDTRPFLCDYCGKSFKRKDALEQHKLSHGDYVKAIFPCELCGKKFTVKSSLQSHLAHHTAQRSFLCDHCGSAFKTRSVQLKHIRTVHLNPRGYKCKLCPRHFSTQYAMKRHLHTHSDIELINGHVDCSLREKNVVILYDQKNLPQAVVLDNPGSKEAQNLQASIVVDNSDDTQHSTTSDAVENDCTNRNDMTVIELQNADGSTKILRIPDALTGINQSLTGVNEIPESMTCVNQIPKTLTGVNEINDILTGVDQTNSETLTSDIPADLSNMPAVVLQTLGQPSTLSGVTYYKPLTTKQISAEYRELLDIEPSTSTQMYDQEKGDEVESDQIAEITLNNTTANLKDMSTVLLPNFENKDGVDMSQMSTITFHNIEQSESNGEAMSQMPTITLHVQPGGCEIIGGSFVPTAYDVGESNDDSLYTEIANVDNHGVIINNDVPNSQIQSIVMDNKFNNQSDSPMSLREIESNEAAKNAEIIRLQKAQLVEIQKEQESQYQKQQLLQLQKAHLSKLQKEQHLHIQKDHLIQLIHQQCGDIPSGLLAQSLDILSSNQHTEQATQLTVAQIQQLTTNILQATPVNLSDVNSVVLNEINPKPEPSDLSEPSDPLSDIQNSLTSLQTPSDPSNVLDNEITDAQNDNSDINVDSLLQEPTSDPRLQLYLADNFQ